MTRLTTSTLTLAAILGTSASLAAFATPLLARSGQVQTLALAKPAQVQTAPALTSPKAAPLLTTGRDGQRTVRVVYVGAVVAR